ncbi:MAG: DinB family protein [Capsulimonas sp.]|uniref:DinB family protein n=1 Tax=Capsulimonas sp. TaxID=2494211 RepID=UPI003266D9A3
MEKSHLSLWSVYDGWDGYQTSLVKAVASLTREQLAWRPAAGWRSVGELTEHISFGRIDWFEKMGAPGSSDLMAKRPPVGSLAGNAEDLVRWLNLSWEMVAETLNAWTVADLAVSYRHTYWGQTYAVSRQWTIWRILSHDMHHGGQLSIMLASQGISAPELIDLGGHLTEPSLAE